MFKKNDSQNTNTVNRNRIVLSLPAFIFIATIANFVLFHYPLFSFASESLVFWSLSGFLSYFTLAVLVFVFTSVALFLISFISIQLTKVFCLFSVAINAVALYFMMTYQVMLDISMLGNILNTRMEEAIDFAHPKLIVYLLFFAVIPGFLLVRTKITKLHRGKIILQASVVLILGLLWIYGASSTWLWFDQNSKKLGGRILPWSYVIGLVRHYSDTSSQPNIQTLLPPADFIPVKNIDQDINKDTDQRKIVVLVIGEAARSGNFSIYGYTKNTTPLVEKQNVVALQNAFSCSTYTTASLKCILSHTDNDGVFSSSYELLPSYLRRHNVDVIWRTNNWGEPPIKVTSYTKADDLRETCNGPGCPFDEALLHNLVERIESSDKRNILVILHQKGSHGPAYNSLYPAEFRHFLPECDTVDLQKCSQQALINAYDNSILYTDHFLNRTINILKDQTNASTMMMYVSDHGESLGEYNLYLHGTPYSVAPDVQKKIPFLLWMSDEYIEAQNISVDKLKKRTSHSQHHVFHSIMGAFNMRSDIYKEDMDLFQ
jgi:lipid A ethanolaminephosphotransferase